MIAQYRRNGQHAQAEQIEALCAPPDDAALPEEAEFIWGVFLSLPRAVSLGFGAALMQEVPFSEIEAWCRVHGGVELEPWEAEALRRLDRLRVNLETEAMRREVESRKKPGA